MPAAVLDSNVLIAAHNDDAENHNVGTAIVDGIDRGVLPEARITNYVVAEVPNLLHGRHGHQLALDTYDRLDRAVSFHVEHQPAADFEQAIDLFQTYDDLAFVDSLVVAYMQRADIEYLYSFDDDFDVLDSVTRLGTDANPYGL